MAAAQRRRRSVALAVRKGADQPVWYYKPFIQQLPLKPSSFSSSSASNQHCGFLNPLSKNASPDSYEFNELLEWSHDLTTICWLRLCIERYDGGSERCPADISSYFKPTELEIDDLII
jgi:hypothetical protein